MKAADKLRGLSAATVRDMSQFERNFGDIDRDVLWRLLEANDFKDEKKFPNGFSIIQFIFDATVMHFKMRHETEKAYIDRLEQTVIDKRTIIENQERELVKIRTSLIALEDKHGKDV